ncbi:MULTISPECIES: low affinity iron permease family protein [unclassified Kitasatospora]|uniref:low affinity iron permease family protein n=1 Tax=unclassified Kitasatospora TaxID=2633591 RepID=UPI0033ECDE69
MAFQHPSERSRTGRGRFERLAEAASNLTSSPAFYAACVLLVLAFVAVHAAGLALEWQILVGDTMTALNLLLLTLLKNAERRAEHAVQRKLDAIATALLRQADGKDPGDARSALEKAIGMEEEV